MRHVPRFYCPDTTLQNGVDVTLPDGAAHHARVVMRLKDGAVVKLFNARDGEWTGVCHYPDKRSVTVQLTEQTRSSASAPSASDIWLVLAPLKNKDSFDNAIRHAVELGVSAIHLVQTAFTQQSKVNMDRLQQQVIDAAQQCGRLSVPAIGAIKPLAALLDHWPADRTLLACVEGSDTIPSLSQMAVTGSCAILIGPEGGFADAEKDNLLAGGNARIQPVSLGSLILRSDTAVAAALGKLSQ